MIYNLNILLFCTLIDLDREVMTVGILENPNQSDDDLPHVKGIEAGQIVEIIINLVAVVLAHTVEVDTDLIQEVYN